MSILYLQTFHSCGCLLLSRTLVLISNPLFPVQKAKEYIANDLFYSKRLILFSPKNKYNIFRQRLRRKNEGICMQGDGFQSV